MVDPTRPAPAWLAAHPSPQGYAMDDGVSGPRVLAVGRTKRLAVIDGQIVKPGDMVNGSKVLSVTTKGIVVEGNGSPQLLKMTSGIEKKRSARRSPGTAGKASSKSSVLLNGNGGSK